MTKARYLRWQQARYIFSNYPKTALAIFVISMNEPPSNSRAVISSILLTRQVPLVIFLRVDDQYVSEMEEWFKEIENGCTRVVFLSEADFTIARALARNLLKTSGVVSAHYGGDAGLLKLFAPYVMESLLRDAADFGENLRAGDEARSDTLTATASTTTAATFEMRTIVLDSDQIFLHDIGQMIPFFEKMDAQGMEFGMPCMHRDNSAYLSDALLEDGTTTPILSLRD